MKRQIVLENDQLIEMVNESARRVLRRLMMENRYDLRGARVLAESDNWMDDHTGGTEANNAAFKQWEATAREQGYSDAYINAIKQINDWVGGGAESNGLIDWSDGTPRVNEKAVAEFSDGDNSWFARNNSAERQEWYNALRDVIDREDRTRDASMALNRMVNLDAQIAQLEQDVAANPDNPGLQMNLEMLKQQRGYFQPKLQAYYDGLNSEAAQLMAGMQDGSVANTPENQTMLDNMQQTLFMLNQNAYPYLNIPQTSTTQDQASQDQTQNPTQGQNQNTNNFGMNNNWGWGINFGNGNQAGYNWLNYNQPLMPGVVTTDANGNKVTTTTAGTVTTAPTTNTTTQGATQTNTTNNTRTTGNAGSARPAATSTGRATNNVGTTNNARTTSNARTTRPAATNNTRVAPSSTVSTATSTPTVNTATSTPTVEVPASYNRTVTFNPPASQVRTEQPPQQPQPQGQQQQQPQQQPKPQPQPQPQGQQQQQGQPGQPTVATHGTGGQVQPNPQQGRTIQAGALNTTPNRYVAGYNNFNPNNVQVRPMQVPQNPYQQQRR